MTRLDRLAVKKIVAMAVACNWMDESELLNTKGLRIKTHGLLL